VPASAGIRRVARRSAFLRFGRQQRGRLRPSFTQEHVNYRTDLALLICRVPTTQLKRDETPCNAGMKLANSRHQWHADEMALRGACDARGT
jgi:hypothetical protein